MLTCQLSQRSQRSPFTAFMATMAAMYKPTEAISLLRPTLLLPRIQPSSNSRVRNHTFSTSRPARATHSSTNSSGPTPPPRKSITLTGDTGQVRWSDLSPGEKAVRTTQQSFNFIVVIAGILATVRLPFTVSQHQSIFFNHSFPALKLMLYRAESATSSSAMSSLQTARRPTSTELQT